MTSVLSKSPFTPFNTGSAAVAAAITPPNTVVARSLFILLPFLEVLIMASSTYNALDNKSVFLFYNATSIAGFVERCPTPRAHSTRLVMRLRTHRFVSVHCWHPQQSQSCATQLSSRLQYLLCISIPQYFALWEYRHFYLVTLVPSYALYMIRLNVITDIKTNVSCIRVGCIFPVYNNNAPRYRSMQDFTPIEP